MTPLDSASQDKELLPSDCTIDQIRDALRWAEDGGAFDHIYEDVPKAAQRWVRAQLDPVEKRFRSWAMAVGMWSRRSGELALDDLEPPLQDWLKKRVMSVLARLESVYEEAKETGRKRSWGSGYEWSKEECQAGYDFIVRGRMPERMSDLPDPLQWDIVFCLEVPGRHLGKEADAVGFIASGMYRMSRTAKDVDAPCMEAVEAGLPDFIQTLKNRLQEA